MTSLMTSQKNGSMENFNFFEISKLTPSLQNNINQKLYIFLIFKMIPDTRVGVCISISLQIKGIKHKVYDFKSSMIFLLET